MVCSYCLNPLCLSCFASTFSFGRLCWVEKYGEVGKMSCVSGQLGEVQVVHLKCRGDAEFYLVSSYI